MNIDIVTETCSEIDKIVDDDCIFAEEKIDLIMSVRNGLPALGKKPFKPVISRRPSLFELDVYKKDLVEYEAEVEAYEKKMEQYAMVTNKVASACRDVIIREIRDVAGKISDAHVAGTYSYAYEHGHSSGYREVLTIARNIAETIFKP